MGSVLKFQLGSREYALNRPWIDRSEKCLEFPLVTFLQVQLDI